MLGRVCSLRGEPLDIVSHGVYLIEKVAESILNDVRTSASLVCIRIDDDAYSAVNQFDVKVCRSLDRVAIIMYYSRLCTVNVQFFGLERLDFGVFVQCLVEHFNAYLWSFDEVERLHDDDVNPSAILACGAM